MTSNEGKDTATQYANRLALAKTVMIVLTTPFDFEVIEPPAKKGMKPRVKYIGKITPDKTGDDCSCLSFVYGQRYPELDHGGRGESIFEAENGHPFQCKHIIKAHQIRGDGHHALD